MALGVRYKGEFCALGGTRYRVEILQEGYDGTNPGVLTFDGDTPLQIEWSETDKMEPVRSSAATLTVISDTDRQYVDLYQVEVGTVRMDIYRNNVLYWSGLLDTELYEEPYSSGWNYSVVLTFSDFACLERMKWSKDKSSVLSLQTMIEECLNAAGIKYSELVKYISTKRYAVSDTPVSFDEIFASQANFYDEEGEALSYREVLEGVLRPFALSVIQKAGKVYIYDLNALSGRQASQVAWDDEDAVLSVDNVYNNVKVTFSAYADAKVMKGTVKENDSLTSDSGGTLFRMDYERNASGALSSLEGFRLHLKDDLESDMTLSGGAKFFQIRSIYSGSDETGVAMSVRAGDYSIKSDDSLTRQLLKAPRNCGQSYDSTINTSTIIKCRKALVSADALHNYRLRINLQLLFDVRYNPFEQQSSANERDAYKNMEDWCNFGYVPIKLTVRDAAGTALWHYHNKGVLESTGYDHSSCSWKTGEADWGDAWLCYYDFSDRKAKTGFGGWATNKPIIGYTRGGLPETWEKIEDGEYVMLPSAGGFIELEIGEGVLQFDYKREVKNIYKYVRWVMYKEPSITLCRRNYKEYEPNDIVDSAWINKAAKEEYSIDTILGTMPDRWGVPSARGALLTSGLSVYDKFARAGKEDRLERLLIGTVYSNYASRHNVLFGTVRLLPGFGVFGDANTAGKFIVLSEVQNCLEDTSEIKMVEFGEDNYEGIEYEQ